MYSIEYSNKFVKSLRLCQKRGFDMDLFRKVAHLLEINGTLPAKYKPHKLKGNYKDCWECHIQPDWLLIWQQNDKKLTLLFTDTGTHTDLFR